MQLTAAAAVDRGHISNHVIGVMWFDERRFFRTCREARWCIEVWTQQQCCMCETFVIRIKNYQKNQIIFEFRLNPYIAIAAWADVGIVSLGGQGQFVIPTNALNYFL